MQKLGKILIIWFFLQYITKQDESQVSQDSVKQDNGLENEAGNSSLVQINFNNQAVIDSLQLINNVYKDKMRKDTYASFKFFKQPIVVRNMVDITQLRDIEDSEKQKAGTHILLYFTIQSLNQFDQLKQYLYLFECQAKKFGDLRQTPSNRIQKNIADINYYQYKKTLEFTQRWIQYKNDLFQYLQQNEHIEDYQEIEKVIDWKSYKEFMDEFTQFRIYIIQEALLVNCGMANYLHFYNLVYRFVYTLDGQQYKNNLSTEQLFQQLYEESQVYYTQIYDSFLHRLYFIYFWAVLMEQLHFLISTKDDKQRLFIQKLIDILLYFDQPIKYSANKIEKVDAYCKSNYEALKNVLSKIEQSLKSQDKKLRKEFFDLDQVEKTQSGSYTSLFKVFAGLCILLLN